MEADSIERDRDALLRLSSIANERTKNLPHTTPLRDVYRRAAYHAERHVDGPLGQAIASVLLIEVERLKADRWDSPLGQSQPMLFLALSVLDCAHQETP